MKFWKSAFVFAAAALPLFVSAVEAKEHPPTVLHITNVGKGRIDFEVKDGSGSWDSGAYILQSYFPMGDGVSAMFPLKTPQTPDTTFWVRYKMPDEAWCAPRKMKEVNGSLDIPAK